MSVLCFIATLMALLSVTVSDLTEFKKFIVQFNKSYKSKEEFQRRLHIFSKNMKEARHLQKLEHGTAKYGVTKFSDLTDEEFNIYNSPVEVSSPPSMKNITINATIPRTCDWRKSGVISQVKNQGLRCASSWAFAVVGNIEAMWGINGQPKNLSVQQVIDCNKCGDGCRRGYQWYAFRTVLEQVGLTSSSIYQYVGKKNTCKTDVRPEGWIAGFKMLSQNEAAMAKYLAHEGTVTVVVNKAPLKLYQKGVIHQPNCNKIHGDHVALIVGYGNGNSKPYWILKNSWGIDWGEKGYYRLYRGENICGINKYPLVALWGSKKNKHKCPQ
ncbi:cathepsin W-like [Spea bombifrons]|uniref:cathepsin W-like n=1 Tax=Spea bombifrons TaxID=233779 RepID=UPI00234BA070|nr:cathepsin W-like [Spea bombifrons]